MNEVAVSMDNVDWQLVGYGIVQLLALCGAYYGLKADNRELAAQLAISMLTERGERAAGQAQLKADFITLSGDVTHRLSTLENGQDEWTKALRQRTHDLASDVQKLTLDVDRLRRPTGDSRS